MNRQLSTSLFLGLLLVVSVVVASALAGGSDGVALAQVSVQPTPTPTFTPVPPTPTFTPVPPTPTFTPVPPTPTFTPVPPTPTFTPVPPEPIFTVGDITIAKVDGIPIDEPGPVGVNTSLTFTAVYTDQGSLDSPVYTADWGWGDGSSSSCEFGSGPDDVSSSVSNSEGCTISETAVETEYLVQDTRSYTEPNVYSVVLTVTRFDGASEESTYAEYLVVVYDPDGGFVTGGGWIDSPAGAYAPDPSLTGKATFGFVSKYKKGADAPVGQTQFQFQVADLNFHSSDYEWLLINQNDSNAQYKGSGTINGAGDYKFMLWAKDLDPDGDDTFRIKIWSEDVDGSENAVYDNGFDQAIGGGSIVIHKGKGQQ